MRDGLDLTVNVASGTAAKGNTNPETITIYGGANKDVINLGTGTDTVVLGGTGEVVNGGGGTALVKATAALAGACVSGGTGTTTLEITTGGTATLNAATTKLTVKLDAATNLTLSKMGFITAIGSASNDTITALAANQTLTGGSGTDTLIGSGSYGDTFKDTVAGLSGDTIRLFGGSDVIDLTDLDFSTFKPLAYNGTSTTGTLTVVDAMHTGTIKFTGSYSLANFMAAADGHGGTLISFR